MLLGEWAQRRRARSAMHLTRRPSCLSAEEPRKQRAVKKKGNGDTSASSESGGGGRRDSILAGEEAYRCRRQVAGRPLCLQGEGWRVVLPDVPLGAAWRSRAVVSRNGGRKQFRGGHCVRRWHSWQCSPAVSKSWNTSVNTDA